MPGKTLKLLVVLLVTATSLRAENQTNAPALPQSVDLRPQLNAWGLTPRRQGARSTCSVFTTAGALEFALSKLYGRGTILSTEYLNWASNQIINNQTADRGQFFHDLLQGFEKYGACEESLMPYQPRFDPMLKPSEVAQAQAQTIRKLGLRIHWLNPWKPKPGLADEHLQQIRGVLAKGYPVAAGSGHSRLIVGYSEDPRQPGGGRFLMKDSGAGAYNTVTYQDLQEKFGDLFWIEPPAGKF